MPAAVFSFNKIKSYLDENISSIYGLEVPLYSDKLRVAGRVDCFCLWDNKLSIVDFKTSRSNKEKDSIHNYFLQSAAYAYMIYERTGKVPSNIVIVMTIDDGDGKIFVEKPRDWIQKFIDLRNSVDL